MTALVVLVAGNQHFQLISLDGGMEALEAHKGTTYRSQLLVTRKINLANARKTLRGQENSYH